MQVQELLDMLTERMALLPGAELTSWIRLSMSLLLTLLIFLFGTGNLRPPGKTPPTGLLRTSQTGRVRSDRLINNLTGLLGKHQGLA